MLLNDFFSSLAKDFETKTQTLTSDDFYYILKYLNIETDTSLASQIETFFQQFLDKLSASLVKYESKYTKEGANRTNYLALYTTTKCPHTECTKLYFPIKYTYLIKVLTKVLVYLVRNNIKCILKFHQKATNEGLVIEFYHKEDVLPFINYCENNFKLNDLLEPLNPFMVSYHGFGIIKNYNGSYIDTISKLLSSYISLIIKNDEYSKISALDFLSYVIDFKDTVLNDDNLNIIIKNLKLILNNNGVLDANDLK